MKQRLLFLAAAAILPLAVAPSSTRASSFEFGVGGSGITGSIDLTYGSTTDATYSGAFAVTGVSGSFSDANIGISNASITGVEPLHLATPEPGNLLTPADFSKFAVASGLEADHGTLSYDNLLYPSGSPQTASSYPPHGGFLDIYGLLFTLNNGDLVNLWSNGDVAGNGLIDYGAAVVTSAQALDFVDSGVTATPEPGTLCLLGTGMLALALVGRRSLAASQL